VRDSPEKGAGMRDQDPLPDPVLMVAELKELVLPVF